MAWVLEEETEEEVDLKESEVDQLDIGNWVMEQEPETDPLRAADSAFIGMGTGAIDMASHLLGGGKNSMVGQQEEFQRNEPAAKYDLEKLLLQGQGLSEEKATERLGERPEVEESLNLRGFIDKITGGTKIPQTSRERIATRAGESAGEFSAFGMLPVGQFLKTVLPESLSTRLGLGGEGETGLSGLMDELKVGARFGAGEEAGKESGLGGIGQFVSGVTAAASPWAWTKGKNAISKAIDFGKSLFKSEGKELPSKIPEFLKEAGTEKALADIELSQKDLLGRTSQLSKEMLSDFEKNVGKVGETSMENVGTFKAADIEKDILKENQKAILNTISPIDASKKDGWSAVIDVVNQNFKAAKETYRKMYQFVEEGASKIEHPPQNLMDQAVLLKDEMKGSLISVAEEGSVKGAAENLIRKLIPEQGKNAENLINDLAKEGIIADFEEVLGMMKKLAEKEGLAKPVTVDKILKTKRSLNRILSKSDIIPAPVDLLRPLVKAAKKDIRAGLSGTPKELEVFDAAEALYSKTQEVFNVPEMVKARKSANPEKLSEYFEQPSNLERLKKSLGSEEAVKNLADKMIVDSISKKTKDAAKELSEESRKFIGEKGQNALDKILEYGDKLTDSGQQAITRANMLADLQNSASTGSRPDYTLKLMKVKQSRKIVKDTLSKSSNGREMLKNLQRMSMDDLMTSVVKDGKIDFEKAHDIISNPEIRSLVKDSLGEDGFKFFQNLEMYGKNMKTNLEQLSLKEPGFMESILEKYLSSGAKAVLIGLTPFTKGASVIPILLKEGLNRGKKLKLHRILESKESQKTIQNLGKRGMSTAETKKALKRFAQVVGKTLEDEDEE